MDIHFICQAIMQYYFIYFIDQILLWQVRTLPGDTRIPLMYPLHCEGCFGVVLEDFFTSGHCEML